ncbi:MAG: TonB-dependent receptor [Segetibacter sp.]|nr:TonB-dependent receptor [Segetibacter sp.]
MKSLFILILLCSIFLISHTNLAAQVTKETTVTFKVAGECAMCKQRIESAAKGKGVTAAIWQLETKHLLLTYNPLKTTAMKVQERIAGVGHDTEVKKADDAVYKALPNCCLYRELGAATKHEVAMATTSDVPATDSTGSVITTITGSVMEDVTGALKPLAGASIIWMGTTTGTTTDSDGKFTLNTIDSAHQLVISYTGFHADTIAVRGQQSLQTVLTPDNKLKAITVSGSRASMSVNTASAIRSYDITPKELMKAACCNLSESFETNPSVDVSFSDAVTGSKQIQMLGLAGNYTQLTVENLPGPRGLATSLGLNSIPGTWVEGIQLIKGTGSVVNGYESIAGQINVELKKPDNSEQLYANIYTNDQGKTDINLNLSKKINNKWSTALLLHDAFAFKKVDMNMDHFKDFPTGNLFSGINRWSYTNQKGLFSQFGVKYLKDDKTGGAITFNPDTDKFSTNHYGLEIDIERKEAFAKIGYVYPGRPYKSIGLQVSAFNHMQDSYFGLTTYNGSQNNFYSNLIYQSIIGHTGHKFKTGVSFVYDKYNEHFNQTNYRRKEVVPGAFFEYIFKPNEKFDLIAGIRGDHNSLYGFFASPRLNVRYELFKGTTIRVSAGRGQRTANIFAENNSVFVSARAVNIMNAANGKAYGLEPEVAWNKGISIDQKFRLFNRSSMFSFDFFRNDFTNQVVVDFENPRVVAFYNLEGKSYSNSFQTEWSVEPIKKLNVRLAYRLFDVKTTYGDKTLQKPLTSKHRAFANLGYEVGTWKFDYTVNYNGSKRLPSTLANPVEYRLDEYSTGFVTMNAQVSKTIGKKRPVDLYFGGENLSNFIQPNAIIAADKPFSQYFDAAQVWGPISGRMVYAGVRFKIK